MNRKERCLLHMGLTAAGGLGYVLIELLWRGRSHWSMFLVGGACFEVIGHIHSRCRKLPLLLRGGLCSAAVTGIEGFSGCILTLALKLDVWDYSTMKWNWKGQVCALYSLLWLGLSIAVCPLYRGLSQRLETALKRRVISR